MAVHRCRFANHRIDTVGLCREIRFPHLRRMGWHSMVTFIGFATQLYTDGLHALSAQDAWRGIHMAPRYSHCRLITLSLATGNREPFPTLPRSVESTLVEDSSVGRVAIIVNKHFLLAHRCICPDCRCSCCPYFIEDPSIEQDTHCNKCLPCNSHSRCASVALRHGIHPITT